MSVFAKHDFGYVFEHAGLNKLFGGGKEEADEGEALAAEVARQEGKSLELSKVPEPLTIPQRLRLAFEELGPTFVKMGQILSTRPDMLPRPYIDEFRKLQDNVGAIPFQDIKEVVEKELGSSLEDRFQSFSEEPLAAASIGQVHRCILSDGREAVLKVQRPGIEDTIKMDLSILYAMARIGNLSSLSEAIDLIRVVQEFERVILRELDFTSEGHLTEEFAQHYTEDPEVKIASIYWDYSTRHLLAMEFLKGTNISDLETLRKKGVDLEKMARKIVTLTMRQIFVDGLFHADPHPGNLMVLEGSVLGIIDFGMVGRFDRYTLRMLRELTFDIVQQDHVSMAIHLLDHDLVGYDADMRELRQDIRKMFRDISSQSMAQASEMLQKFILRHKLRFPADLFFLDKTFGTLDGTVRLLSPNFSYHAVMSDFTKELTFDVKSMDEALKALGFRLLQDMDALVELPILMRRLLRRAEAGHLEVHNALSVTPQTFSMINRLLLRLFGCFGGTTLLLVAGWLLATRPNSAALGGIGVEWWLLWTGIASLSLSLWSFWRDGRNV
ncbi:MAG: AarF/ABC1/UbiB kinase family protein [Myxococcales bacterium]|nr:AarF/ABC1/UbiB kinase family protein [Myxococcales bacterium]